METVGATIGARSGLTFRPLAGRIGAVVEGVRLAGEIPKPVADAILAGLWKHKVLFFRGQHDLTDVSQEAFAERLGTPVAHPTLPSLPGTRYVLPVNGEEARANDWHTDATFMHAYPVASILRAVELPPYGGDTVFSNTAAAYAELPEVLQRLADQLWIRHTNGQDIYAKNPHAILDTRGQGGGPTGEKESMKKLARKVQESDHPLVRVHPHSGERVFVLGNWAQRILGVSVADSAQLIGLFQGHITRLDNCVRWSWQPGDVAMWDNVATQHYAVDDYGDARRWLRRVTLAGEVPVGVDGRRSVTRFVEG